MRKLNILLLADFRWYNASAHYALSLSRALAKCGQKVFLGLTSSRQFPPIIDSAECLHIFDLDYNPAHPLTFLSAAQKLSKLIENEGIQIVNCHSAGAHFLAAYLKAINPKRFILVRTRGEAHPPKPSPFNKFLYSRLTDYLIVPASILVDRNSDILGLNRDRITFIPLGIEESVTTSTGPSCNWRAKLGLSAEEKVVGMVGRLSPVKGHIYFIQCAREVVRQIPNTKFIIAGPPAQLSYERLKRIAFDCGVIDRFIFLGMVDNVHELISIFDVGVVCSIGSETICRVLLEYMLAGKPVVGTRVNGISDLIQEDRNGFRIDPADFPGLAPAIIKLLDNDNLRLAMGRESGELASTKYNIDGFAELTLGLYLRLVGEIGK